MWVRVQGIRALPIALIVLLAGCGRESSSPTSPSPSSFLTGTWTGTVTIQVNPGDPNAPPPTTGAMTWTFSAAPQTNLQSFTTTILTTAFLPDDWIAVLLKCHDTGEAVQRVGPLAMVLAPRFQSWLRFKNAHGFSIFVGVNAITPGQRSRTRESVGAVRHVFLDADEEADRVLSAIAARPDLPPPSYIVRSSKGRAHVIWRVEGFAIQRVEALQKHLARELGTDIAATSGAQLTRLPGGNNHKYSPPQLVQVDYGEMQSTYAVHEFPEVPAAAEPPASAPALPVRRRGGMPMIERARRYVAATPPALQGQRGDERTFHVCCRLLHTFALTDAEVLDLLTRWNARCEPPWSDAQLAAKVKSARRYSDRSQAEP